MRAHLARSVEGEYVLIIRSFDLPVMLSVLRKLQKMRYRDLKDVFRGLEEKLYE